MENNMQDSKLKKHMYDTQYNKEHYTQLKIRYKTELNYIERLKILSIGTHKSQNQLLIEAIEDLLNKYNA